MFGVYLFTMTYEQYMLVSGIVLSAEKYGQAECSVREQSACMGIYLILYKYREHCRQADSRP